MFPLSQTKSTDKGPDPEWEPKSDWWKLYRSCESPIEKRLCVALSHAWPHAIPRTDQYTFEKIRRLAVKHGGYVIGLFGQQKIEKYRLDFMAVSYSVSEDWCVRIAVECDGYEFHLGSAVGAIKDRHRDRFLRSRGILTYRFTGTQITRAADEIASYLSSQII